MESAIDIKKREAEKFQVHSLKFLALFQLGPGSRLKLRIDIGHHGKSRSSRGERSAEFITCLHLSLFLVLVVVREESKRLYWLWRFGAGGRVFTALLYWDWQTCRQTGYGPSENKQILRNMYRLGRKAPTVGLPTKWSRAGRMQSGSDSSTTFLDLGTGLGQRPIVC